ncbi:CDP-diacylglycerol-inositol 3-phosphatidyltransferase [Ascosphaera aggregata]|nr:CDP-diacylglycerol-inositol 3-phosphatidyltransferase [Ascosphaera aggregata]
MDVDEQRSSPAKSATTFAATTKLPKENVFLFWPNIIDGYAARHFNQSTTFGAVLDMVTDRCTTACLLVFLSSAWPRWAIVFQILISLDLASHYMHMYATLTMGEGGQSHKKVDQSRSKILYLYYTNKPAQHIEAKASLSTIFANPWSAGALELARANKMDSFWPWVITGISAPIMAAKQSINIVQLVKASKWLVEGDLERRRASGEAAIAAKGK